MLTRIKGNAVAERASRCGSLLHSLIERGKRDVERAKFCPVLDPAISVVFSQ
jgi:hypothetical protein